jgi:hypothetical protein
MLTANSLSVNKLGTTNFKISPQRLFTDGSNGFWLDASDQSTLFQNSAGATPVTALGDPVGLWLDKHESDGRGIVNLFAYSDEMTNAYWGKLNGGSGSVLPALTLGFTDPFGGTKAVRIQTNKGVGTTSGAFSVVGRSFTGFPTGNYTRTFWIKSNTGSTQNVMTYFEESATPQTLITVAGTNWVAVTVTNTSATGTFNVQFGARGGVSYGGDNVLDFLIYAPQLELGPTATAYQANGASVGGPGNHFVQTTSGARPVWGSWPLSAAIAGQVRNLLSYTEQFNNASWTKTRATVTANAINSPTGTLTADFIIPSVDNNTHSVNQAVLPAGTSTITVYAKTGGYHLWIQMHNTNGSTAYFDLSLGTVSNTATFPATFGAGATQISKSITALPDGWYRCELTATIPVGGNAIFGVAQNGNTATYIGDTTSGIYLWGAQLEQASTATAYQRVGVSSRSDVSEAGQPQVYFVSPDGTDDFLVSAANVDFSATDRMFVCAGVTKKSEAASGVIAELTNGVSNGRFTLTSPTGVAANAFNFSSAGTLGVDNALADSLISPVSAVLSGLGEIVPASNTIRKNGVLVQSLATTQGTGNYANALTYIGARAGTSVFASTNIYQVIAVGKTPTTPELNATENFVAQKTKGSLA